MRPIAAGIGIAVLALLALQMEKSNHRAQAVAAANVAPQTPAGPSRRELADFAEATAKQAMRGVVSAAINALPSHPWWMIRIDDRDPTSMTISYGKAAEADNGRHLDVMFATEAAVIAVVEALAAHGYYKSDGTIIVSANAILDVGGHNLIGEHTVLPLGWAYYAPSRGLVYTPE